jgi:hypothetical protein
MTRWACAVRPRGWRLMTIAMLAACVPADGSHTSAGAASAYEVEVLDATLTELFARRERARSITVWENGRRFAPTMAAFGGPFDDADTLALIPAAHLELDVPFRVERTTLRDMEAFFRTDPEGWDAWFEAHPGNAGVVEIVRPRIRGDSAQVIIGRACGEHCRTAWRVRLARTGMPWRVQSVEVLRVPR